MKRKSLITPTFGYITGSRIAVVIIIIKLHLGVPDEFTLAWTLGLLALTFIWFKVGR